MATSKSFVFLGTGTSVGVPVIGCGCEVCVSGNPRNQRLRSSVVLDVDGVKVLVDSGPDLRAQALRAGLRELDAVVYTHAHLDHVAGFDELRAFCWRREEPLPLYANEECMAALKRMYGWAFSEKNLANKGYVQARECVIDGSFEIAGVNVTPLPVLHGSLETVGFLFAKAGMRSVAYVPDVKVIPLETMALMKGVDVLVVDSLRVQPHTTHFSVAEALAAIDEIEPGEAWLTHLSHEVDYEVLEKGLPTGVRVAWDGLAIDLA